MPRKLTSQVLENVRVKAHRLPISAARMWADDLDDLVELSEALVYRSRMPSAPRACLIWPTAAGKPFCAELSDRLPT